jgi:hypothetical protein
MNLILTSLVVLTLLLTAYVARADERYFDRLADAIWWAEGGEKTRFPYGVKILVAGVYHPAENPRATCLAIIRRQHKRWASVGRPDDFVFFLSQTYCPPTADWRGNLNWRNNVRFYLKLP